MRQHGDTGMYLKEKEMASMTASEFLHCAQCGEEMEYEWVDGVWVCDNPDCNKDAAKTLGVEEATDERT